MRLDDLKIFCLVCEQKGFLRAAQRAGITQSAVTKVIRKLEANYGVILLERGGEISLTPAGKTLYVRSVEILELSKSMENDMAAERSGIGGTLRLGIVPALFNTVARPIITKLLRSDPSTNLKLNLKLSNELLDLVVKGQIDMAVCFDVANTPLEIVRQEVSLQRYRLVVRQGHPMANCTVTLEELSRVQWLVPSSNVRIRNVMDRIFADINRKAHIRMEVDMSAAWFDSLLLETDLVTLMTEENFERLAKNRFAPIHFDCSPFQGSIVIYHRRNMPTTPLFSKIKHQFVEAFSPNKLSRQKTSTPQQPKKSAK
jgi:DNA-binding transcriptional LysR family regulator